MAVVIYGGMSLTYICTFINECVFATLFNE